MVWWLAALTVLVVVAVVLAVFVLVRCSAYMRHARGVIAAYAPLVERQTDTAERLLPFLEDRTAEPTERLAPVVVAEPGWPSDEDDVDLYGRHALATRTALLPAAGKFRVPPYYFAALKDERR
ncbi:hypothetical protein [Amycolatopsis thermoflava]|uniref:hypothetical protein n=1 Tax=Amycolatopsis thermoflava TaxID=84480 RepID=UPI003F4A0361